MSILDRYIGKQIILTITLITFALLGVDVFFYLVNELRFVGKGDYTLFSALLFILLTIPRKLYLLFPWGALLGSLLALGNLAKYSELVAIRVASVSVMRIAWAALKAGLILTLIMFIFGEVISPSTEMWAQRKKSLALSRGQAIQTQFGTWIRHNNEFIHVGVVAQPKDLQDITRYTFDKKLQLQAVEHAATAKKRDGSWDLTEVVGTKFNLYGTEIVQNDQTQVQNLLDTEILQASAVKHLERLTLTKLYRLIKNRVAQELNATEYERAFWLKVVQPFTALAMIFLAVPFAFGPLRSTSVGLKVIVGIMVGFSFYTLNSIFGPLTEVSGLSPMLAAIIPTSLCLMLGYFMVRRVP
jgi:lipopolysaccharide export system permease protein